MSSAGPFQYGTSKTRTSPPTSAASWSTPDCVRPQRPADAEQVRPQPERVAALDRAGRLDAAERSGCPRPCVQASRMAGSPGAVRLAGSERDRAAVGDEQRVEGVDEVRVAGRVGARARGRSGRARRATSTKASCSRCASVEVDRLQEAVGRVVERPPEGRAGPLDEHVAQRRRSCSGRRSAARSSSSAQYSRGPDRRSTLARTMAGYAVNARIERVEPHASRRRVDRRGVGGPTGRATPAAASTPIDHRAATARGDPRPSAGTRIRERWAQMTFFLFDPDSWR